MARESYFTVLTEAVNDMLDHGFDSAERVAHWQKRLKDAAEASSMSLDELDRMMREALKGVYDRYVDKGKLLQFHKGVERWAYDRIKPKLRAELDRRIAASLDLIKLNREQMMARQAQRFAGWATSLPVGGPTEADRRELKDRIRKPLASLSFEERRVFIDQGHKLVSSINSVVATDCGALAAKWRHVHQAGYAARPEHLKRDGEVFVVRGNWALDKGLMKPGDHQYTDQIEQPAEFPYCLPAESKIPYADGVRVAYRRWYDGELTELVTNSGKALRLTPNHPVLTPHGWVAAGLLHEGDHIIEASEYRVSAAKSHQDQTVASIAEIFGALDEAGVRGRIGGSRQQFHGDGADGDVDVILSAWPLSFWAEAALPKSRDQVRLAMPLLRRAPRRALEAFGLPGARSPARFVSAVDEVLAALYALVGHTQQGGLMTAANFGAGVLQVPTHHGARYREPTGYGEFALSGGVGVCDDAGTEPIPDFGARFAWAPVEAHAHSGMEERVRVPVKDVSAVLQRAPFATKPTKLIEVNRTSFSGHVYNLETADGWYVADGIVTHNCRCSYVYLYSLRQLPDDMLTAKGRQSLEQSRALAAA